jgi:putative exporter of polyketide antibiotics
MGDTGPGGNIYKYRFVAGTEVPIPAALLLFATALGGLGFMGYRRRKLGA